MIMEKERKQKGGSLMKKTFAMLMMGALMVSAVNSAQALTFTFSQSQLLSIAGPEGNVTEDYLRIVDVLEGNSYLNNPTAFDSGVTLKGNIDLGDDAQAGDIGYLEVFFDANPLNLSDYSRYGLTFANYNDDVWGYQLFVRRGEGNYTTSGEFAWLNPSPLEPYSTSLFMDLGDNIGSIDEIGFRIAFEATLRPCGDRVKTGDMLETQVTPIPEPGTLALLSTGLLGLIGTGVTVKKKKEL